MTVIDSDLRSNFIAQTLFLPYQFLWASFEFSFCYRIYPAIEVGIFIVMLRVDVIVAGIKSAKPLVKLHSSSGDLFLALNFSSLFFYRIIMDFFATSASKSFPVAD